MANCDLEDFLKNVERSDECTSRYNASEKNRRGMSHFQTGRFKEPVNSSEFQSESSQNASLRLQYTRSETIEEHFVFSNLSCQCNNEEKVERVLFRRQSFRR